jgi:uncharacterized protein (TIGR00290 family)
MPNDRTAVLWTGGKDSALALHGERLAGRSIACLATFAPPGASFRAHPLEVMAAQAAALRLPHRVLEVVEPFEQGYRDALERLCREEGLARIVTGDIAEVAGLLNWIRQRCQGLDVEVVMPLWHRPREELMGKLLGAGFQAVLSCVKRPWFEADWLGRRLDAACVADLRRLVETAGLDLCGENGEYHTVVLDGPGFAESLEIAASTPREEGDVMYLEIGQVTRREKAGG